MRCHSVGLGMGAFCQHVVRDHRGQREQSCASISDKFSFGGDDCLLLAWASVLRDLGWVLLWLLERIRIGIRFRDDWVLLVHMSCTNVFTKAHARSHYGQLLVEGDDNCLRGGFFWQVSGALQIFDVACLGEKLFHRYVGHRLVEGVPSFRASRNLLCWNLRLHREQRIQDSGCDSERGYRQSPRFLFWRRSDDGGCQHQRGSIDGRLGLARVCHTPWQHFRRISV
mmetsp:Transcript_38414/g.60748  ORF Transcript_38414/g.60748 Transcript_38414/m.60748 type:complete len:226 (+) Transcript_38414:186-863(+)